MYNRTDAWAVRGIRKLVAGLTSLVILSGIAGAVELTPRPQVTVPRLYVIDCGTIVNDRPEDYGLTREEVKTSYMADMCYLIVHPKGALLWDTGLSDQLVGRPLYENFFFNYAFLKLNTLRGQLADIGFSPEMIDYLALSHDHLDHSGNANMFVASTWLTSKPERDEMFAAPAGTKVFGRENFDRLKTAKTIIIPDDYDVFGDGTVVIKEAFGHSPGHQVLAIKLHELGTVILAGDLWHYPEERALNRIGERDAKTAAPQARAAIDAWAKAHDAQIWLAHDLVLFKKLRKSPGYYE